MSDIELVVKLPEEIYKASQIIDVKHEDVIQIPLEVITNGTPLPKAHGELVDRDAINERFDSIYNDAMNRSNQPSDKYLLDKLSMCLDTALPIIEADTESENKKEETEYQRQVEQYQYDTLYEPTFDLENGSM